MIFIFDSFSTVLCLQLFVSYDSCYSLHIVTVLKNHIYLLICRPMFLWNLYDKCKKTFFCCNWQTELIAPTASFFNIWYGNSFTSFFSNSKMLTMKHFRQKKANLMVLECNNAFKCVHTMTHTVKRVLRDHPCDVSKVVYLIQWRCLMKG